jgi:hypothetical protein
LLFTHVDNVHWCCSLSTDVWVLTHRKGTCRVLLHVSAAWSRRQHHDSDRCAAVFIISFVSTVLLSLRHVTDIVSWRMSVCGLPDEATDSSKQTLMRHTHESLAADFTVAKSVMQAWEGSKLTSSTYMLGGTIGWDRGFITLRSKPSISRWKSPRSLRIWFRPKYFAVAKNLAALFLSMWHYVFA